MTEWDIALQALRHHWKSIGFGMIGGIILAAMIFTFQPRIWKTEMIIAPTDRAMLPPASYSQIHIPPDAASSATYSNTTQNNDFNLFETMMLSPEIAQSFQANYASLVPNGIDDIHDYFKRHIQIHPYGLTPYRQIIFYHKDKDKSAAILGAMYKLTDQTIRQNKQIKSQRRIAYLNDQLDKTHNPTHRDALLSLLREQEQTAMMVAIDNAFAADIVEAPYVTPTPAAPVALILFPAFIVIGGMGGLTYSSLKKALLKK